jgi:hypothetical protein
MVKEDAARSGRSLVDGCGQTAGSGRSHESFMVLRMVDGINLCRSTPGGKEAFMAETLTILSLFLCLALLSMGSRTRGG